jgi:hypothetical protein
MNNEEGIPIHARLLASDLIRLRAVTPKAVLLAFHRSNGKATENPSCIDK